MYVVSNSAMKINMNCVEQKCKCEFLIKSVPHGCCWTKLVFSGRPASAHAVRMEPVMLGKWSSIRQGTAWRPLSLALWSGLEQGTQHDLHSCTL